MEIYVEKTPRTEQSILIANKNLNKEILRLKKERAQILFELRARRLAEKKGVMFNTEEWNSANEERIQKILQG
jgi:hypothetical protein